MKEGLVVAITVSVGLALTALSLQMRPLDYYINSDPHGFPLVFIDQIYPTGCSLVHPCVVVIYPFAVFDFGFWWGVSMLLALMIIRNMQYRPRFGIESGFTWAGFASTLVLYAYILVLLLPYWFATLTWQLKLLMALTVIAIAADFVFLKVMFDGTTHRPRTTNILVLLTTAPLLLIALLSRQSSVQFVPDY